MVGPQDALSVGSAAAVAVAGALYRTANKTARTLRKARARMEVHERYERVCRRLLDEAGIDPARYAYPPALRYLQGGTDELDDEDGDL